jgi:hypothetical protein
MKRLPDPAFCPQLRYQFQGVLEPYRPTSGAHEAWAAKFLGRFGTAKAAAAAHSEDNNS